MNPFIKLEEYKDLPLLKKISLKDVRYVRFRSYWRRIWVWLIWYKDYWYIHQERGWLIEKYYSINILIVFDNNSIYKIKKSYNQNKNLSINNHKT